MQKIYSMTRILSEQEKVRRESLQKLRELGIEPYPAEMFDVNITSKQIKDSYKDGKELECYYCREIDE